MFSIIYYSYGYCDKISDKIKYLIVKKVALQIVLIIILQKSKLTDMILHLLKKY